MLLERSLNWVKIIEHLLDFFDRPSFSLDDGRIHHSQLYKMKNHCIQLARADLQSCQGQLTENRVRLPANVLKGNRRRILIDEAGNSSHESLESHAFGSDLVCQNLSRVERLQWSPWRLSAKHEMLK